MNVELSGERSIRKLSSLVELSVQVRLICAKLTAVAVSAPGAAGGGGSALVPMTLKVPLVFNAAMFQARPEFKGGSAKAANAPA